ncbi:hypothetical protein FRB99_003565 [Tulasnella sp. 403]|nr:hypothetical protein FRB99_003565 [Tulasnella sp. 403]
MPALERVRLEDLTREMIFFEDEEPFTDFTLEHLNRAEFIRSFPAYALRRLKAPNLESFIFHYALSGESPGPAEALPVFLAAAPLLRDLEILRLEVRWKWWRDVLPHLASLRRLRLLGTNARQRHLGLLIWGEESHDPEAVPSYHCPNLEELVLDNELLLTSTIVRRIIKSRTSPGGDCSVIRSITMRGCAPESVRGNDVREIRNLVDHFVLGVLDTRSVERDLDESSSSSDGDTASEDWELASGDVEVIQGRVLRN